mmetsp:Transcript_172/g.543  ORF Transcript_172/g.543 Transcript_172/m.543 type:complete len:301 (-) Transcript_172:64-966(-)
MPEGNGDSKRLKRCTYSEFQKDYPSALQDFDKFAERLAGKRVLVFLDYDGTLSPIVNDPDKAYMPDSMRQVVKEAATLFPTAIISGREREKVFSFVQLQELYYAGSHGLDICGPRTAGDGSMYQYMPECADGLCEVLDEVHSNLCQSIKDIEGASVEHNKLCLSAHYRRVPQEHWPVVRKKVEECLNGHTKLFRLAEGRKVLEIRPTVNWDKGRALEWLLNMLEPDAEDTDVVSLYLGDDKTDEDAFRVLRRRGCGVGILVSSIVKPTEAQFTLQDTAEVQAFLEKLVSWGKEQQSAAAS